jgi:hypothetical protein
MTRDDIIRMARHAGMFKLFNDPNAPDALIGESIEQFAALVAAAEREACAKVCECFNSEPVSHATVAAEIRKRGDEK